MTLLSSGTLEIEIHAAPETGAAERRRDERAGYGNCVVCGCGGYSDDGTGDCRCGHSFGQHYS